MQTDSRLQILIFGLGILLVGGGIYGGLKVTGVSDLTAQTGASILLLVGLLGWTFGYLRRVLTGQMSLHHQRQVYETEQLQRMVEQMTPEQVAAFQAELEQERAEQPTPETGVHPDPPVV